ncbi:hypothetical protein HID58_021207 [Brassica napus]|uniref:NYN domain-containing protein n=3 Tax=Brassica napus TaxID=3708 RepID=A0ABQ8CVT3_BRANA|nr:hypothetical protein HID58_021207 [Brassica napus]
MQISILWKRMFIVNQGGDTCSIVNKCKQASDVRIIQRIDHWMADTLVLATLLLIAGDKNFDMALRKVERAGYNMILAFDESNVARLLEYVGHKQLTWREILLLEGTLNCVHVFPWMALYLIVLEH